MPDVAAATLDRVMDDHEDPDELLTPREAAQLLKVSERTLRLWTARGEVRGAFKPGPAAGPWRYRRRELLHVRAEQNAED